jgi:hypothetical protein
MSTSTPFRRSITDEHYQVGKAIWPAKLAFPNDFHPPPCGAEGLDIRRVSARVCLKLWNPEVQA